MTQRLGLARVLLHDPDVLLLDEPASGLDPRARIEIRGLLKEMGKTILVSSHILPELADICNKIGIIERGELLVSGDVTEVMKQVRQQTLLRITVTEPDKAAAELEKHEESDTVTVTEGQLLVSLQTSVSAYGFIPTLLIEKGHRITLFQEDEINLETAFMELTKGITN